MEKFVHHPDNLIIVNGNVIGLSEFTKAFPEYKLPDGVIGREFVKGSHHKLFTNDTQYPGEYPWSDGDRYIKEFDSLTKKLERKKKSSTKKVPLAKKLEKAVCLTGGMSLIEMGVYGNVWIRKQFYPKKEVVHEGHYHNHDHVSLVAMGKVLVEVEGEKNTVFTAPTFFTVDKNKKHTITALEDNTAVFCIYGLVDEKGNPTNEFNGNNSPYGHRVK